MSNGWSVPGAALAVAVLLVVAPAAAQEAAVAPARADTVRTNIWLVEALMADVVTASEQVLPAPPASLLLAPRSETEENDLFGATAFRLLTARGYDVYAAPGEGEDEPLHDVRYGFAVAGVDLTYPEVGRTLGLWRNWVRRDLEVSVFVNLTEAASGRILLSQRVTRTFSDRVPDDAFDAVDSEVYPFTTAPTSEGGWQRRLEEIVVLGALTGLVVIYFANTNN